MLLRFTLAPLALYISQYGVLAARLAVIGIVLRLLATSAPVPLLATSVPGTPLASL
jgi:hypothetical protein